MREYLEILNSYCKAFESGHQVADQTAQTYEPRCPAKGTSWHLRSLISLRQALYGSLVVAENLHARIQTFLSEGV